MKPSRVFCESCGPQYLLGYYPKNQVASENRYHRVTVATPKKNMKVTARTGYYEP